MHAREATSEDSQDWNTFVLNAPYASFLQTWEWGEVQRELGFEVLRLVVEEGADWIASALLVSRPLALGRSWIYIPRGPLLAGGGNQAEALALLTEECARYARKRGAIFVRADPAIPKDSTALFDDDWKAAEREVQPAHTLLLDLRQSEDDLLANMKSKTRYNVRLAERKGVRVRFSQRDKDVQTFLDLAREVRERSGFRYHPDEYYQAAMRTLRESSEVSAELALAEFGDEPIAAHFMVYAGTTATYAHGASSANRRNLMGPHRLYWETIRRAKQLGCATYDFFGVAPPGASKDHPWHGITRIKEGFNGKRVAYIGAHDLVIDEGLYHLFNTARRLRSVLR